MTDADASDQIVPVVLCGGSGTRLWPRSRKTCPKPFLSLVGEKSLFEQTLDRFGADAGFAPPVIVAGEAHRELIEEQSGGRDGVRMVIEPAARNTAPAIGLAAHLLPADAVMLVCPSDHHIAKTSAFREATTRAAELARTGALVSLGIVPTAPETGYGYLKRGEPLGAGFRTERFVEKPDIDNAKEFLADGGYLWNAGIFAFTAARFLEELAAHRPKMAAALFDSARTMDREASIIRPAEGSFKAIEGDSIDYAVMENTAHAALVEADIGWSDIGNWQALRDARETDADGNVALGSTELVDCRNVMAETDGPRVSVIGLEDVIVVVDGDEVLVTSTQGTQLVGKLRGASDQ